MRLIMSAIVLIGLVAGEKMDLPLPCAKTSDCTNIPGLPREAFCKGGYCMCPQANREIKTCSSIDTGIHEKKSPGPLIFRTCKHDQECNMEGGFCNTTINQCDCSKNFVPSSNKQRCVAKVRSIESPCTDVNQCLAFLANTTCQDDKCVCAAGYHYLDNACWRMIEYGQPCTRDQECSYVEGVVCSGNMTCECTADTVLNADAERCLNVVQKMRDECTESVQCTARFQYSSCIDKTCQCQEEYHYEEERCFPNRAIDADCANDHECYQAEDYSGDPPTKSLVCDLNKCRCADDYLRDGDRCVSSAAASCLAASLSVIIALSMLIRAAPMW